MKSFRNTDCRFSSHQSLFYCDFYHNWVQSICPALSVTNLLRDILLRKNAFFWIFFPNEGGGHLGTSSRGAFLVNKGVYFFQNANNLNCRLYEYISSVSYSIFSPKLTFKSWISTSGKSGTSCPNGGRGVV